MNRDSRRKRVAEQDTKKPVTTEPAPVPAPKPAPDLNLGVGPVPAPRPVAPRPPAPAPQLPRPLAPEQGRAIHVHATVELGELSAGAFIGFSRALARYPDLLDDDEAVIVNAVGDRPLTEQVGWPLARGVILAAVGMSPFRGTVAAGASIGNDQFVGPMMLPATPRQAGGTSLAQQATTVPRKFFPAVPTNGEPLPVGAAFYRTFAKGVPTEGAGANLAFRALKEGFGQVAAIGVGVLFQNLRSTVVLKADGHIYGPNGFFSGAPAAVDYMIGIAESVGLPASTVAVMAASMIAARTFEAPGAKQLADFAFTPAQLEMLARAAEGAPLVDTYAANISAEMAS